MLLALGYSAFWSMSGILGDESRHNLSLRLEEGGQYWFFGGCDEDCGDLDLKLDRPQGSGQDGDRQVLQDDVLRDAIPVIHYEAQGQEDVGIEILILECYKDQCGWDCPGVLSGNG